MDFLKRTLLPEIHNDGDILVPLMDMDSCDEVKHSGAKQDTKNVTPATEKTTTEIESRSMTWRDNVWLAITVLLLTAAVALPIYGFWQARRNQAELQTLSYVTQFTFGVECGKYDAGTGVYSLTRGGMYFEKPAQDDVQFLSGYESACTSCPAVPGATYGLVTPGDCTNIDDGFGNAGIASRRNKNLGCSATTTFTAGVNAGAVVANRLSTASRFIRGGLNAGSTETSRCDSSDFLASAGSDSLHTSSLRDELYRTRNAYFVNTNDRVGLCFCHPCGLSTSNSINAAGGGSNCDAYKSYAGETTEVCMYSPIGNWGGNLLA